MAYPRRLLTALSLIILPLLAGSRTAPVERDLLIVGTDYAFTVPAVVGHGSTVISFENRGQHRHEMHLVALMPGISVDSALKVGPGADRKALYDYGTGGILFADPGQRSTGRLLVDLESGRSYFLRCSLQDAPDRPLHSAMGMLAGFTVR